MTNQDVAGSIIVRANRVTGVSARGREGYTTRMHGYVNESLQSTIRGK